MELRHIRYFLAVAEQRNFTRAAEKLGIAQPPLSQQIQALESELGGPLFRRVPQGAELTPAGDAFLVEAKLTIAAAERAKLAAMRAQRGAVGRLLLGITTSATFNQIIGSTIDAFHRTWPDVQLALEELTTAALYERVLRGELDMAFVRPGDGDPSGVNLRHLPDEATFIALPADHRLAQHEALRLTEIAREPFIAFPREVGPSLYDEIAVACHANGFTPHVVQYVQHIASTVTLVAAHLGVSIVPMSISQIKLDGVVYIPIEGRAPIARLALVTAKGVRSAISQNFLSLLPSPRGAFDDPCPHPAGQHSEALPSLSV